MFESIEDVAGTLTALTRLRRERLERECAELELVAHWADVTAGQRGPGEFASMELGAVLATTTTAADRLVADATDLRRRWPHLWALVRAGAVPAWKVRRVSQAARHVSDEAVVRLDAELDGLVTSLPWSRFEHILDAKIISVDPAQAEKRAEQWEAERFVRTGQTRRYGIKLLVAQAAAGDVIWCMAMINRLAEILRADGDLDPVEHRRAKAIGILAQPALAPQLLTQHRHDANPEPADPEPAPNPENETADEAARETEGEREGEAAEPHTTVRFDLPGTSLDPARVAPTVVLHIHLSREAISSGAGVARVEGVGPLTVGELRDFLGTRTCRIRVRPVLDPATVTPVDAYEIPTRTAEAVRHRHPVEVFPYGTQPSRTADLDHTIPYRTPSRGGPPGQTRPDNLGPLSRRHHRAKTFGGWTLRQPEPGVNVWRSPHGHVFHVGHHGTHPLGTGSYARALWSAVTRLDRTRTRSTYEKTA